MLSRRDLLRSTALGSIAMAGQLVTGRTLHAAEEPAFTSKERLPIVQGMTDATSAQFRILGSFDRDLALRFTTGDGREVLPFKTLDRYRHPSARKSPIEHVLVEGLELGVDHRLQILNVENGKIVDERIFRALDLEKPNLRFAMMSCMLDFHTSKETMWKAVREEEPEVLFFVGDTTYSDFTVGSGEGSYWFRYLQTRRNLDVFQWRRLVPVFAVWDDHDFGANDGNSNFKLKDATKNFFQAAFGSVARPGLVHGPGVSSCLRLAGQRFVLLDGRYFRSAPRAPSNETHWGQLQEEWLFEQIGTGTEPTWLLNGSQYFGGYLGSDSFENHHPKQFERVLSRLSKVEAPVIFGSGDTHFSELMRIEPAKLGYETFEITSSAIHSVLHTDGTEYDNPRRMVMTNSTNFVMVDSSARAGSLAARVKCVGPERRNLFTTDLQVKRS